MDLPRILGKCHGLLLGIPRKIIGNSLGYTREFPWAISGNPCKFSGILPGLPRKIFGECLGNTRASPVTNPCGTRPSISRGISGNFPGFYRDFPGKSLGDGWQTPGGTPEHLPGQSTGIHANLPGFCRDFPGKSLGNPRSTPEHLPGQILRGIS